MNMLNCNYMLLLQAGPDDTSVVLFASFAAVPLGAAPDPNDRCRIRQKGAKRSRRRPTETGLCGTEPTTYDTDLGRPRSGFVGKVTNIYQQSINLSSIDFLRHALHLFLLSLIDESPEDDCLTDCDIANSSSARKFSSWLYSQRLYLKSVT